MFQLTYFVSPGANVFNPAYWWVNLAGFAINADITGGGASWRAACASSATASRLSTVGMLIARFAVYGLSVYGGYGTGLLDGAALRVVLCVRSDQRTNRRTTGVLPDRHRRWAGDQPRAHLPRGLSTFDEFPFIKALNPAAEPADNPMAELAVTASRSFPMKSGEFWFAAGISFTSFALVDGVAVVSVAIGDGLGIALLGLARIGPSASGTGAGVDRTGPHRAFFLERGRAVDSGPTDGQLLDPGRMGSADRWFCVRHLVRGTQRRAVRAHARRLPSQLQAPRLSRRPAAWIPVERQHPDHREGRSLLRADVRGGDGRRMR